MFSLSFNIYSYFMAWFMQFSLEIIYMILSYYNVCYMRWENISNIPNSIVYGFMIFMAAYSTTVKGNDLKNIDSVKYVHQCISK